jgi:hypothetical protein
MIYRTTPSTGRQKAASGDRNAAVKFGGQLTEFQQLNAPDKLVIFALTVRKI